MAKRSTTTPLEKEGDAKRAARNLRVQEPCDPHTRCADAVRAAVQQVEEVSGLVQLSAQPLLLGFYGMLRTHHCGYWPANQAIGESVLRVLETAPYKERARLMQFLCDLMNGQKPTPDESRHWCGRLAIAEVAELGTIKIVARHWAYELEESDRYVHESRLSPFLFRLTLVSPQ